MLSDEFVNRILNGFDDNNISVLHYVMESLGILTYNEALSLVLDLKLSGLTDIEDVQEYLLENFSVDSSVELPKCLK